MKKPIIPLKLPFGAGGFPSLFPLRGLGGFLVAWLAILLVACHKDKDPEPSLPPETQTGANTFGCMLNGEVWLPNPRGQGTLPPLECTPEGNGILSIYARYTDSKRSEKIGLYSANVNGVGVFEIKKGTSNIISYSDYKKNTSYYSQDFDTSESGQLTIIKFDLNNRIISGRFWFTLAKNDGTTVKVTDGRFDLKF